jgi:hypothetical protein
MRYSDPFNAGEVWFIRKDSTHMKFQVTNMSATERNDVRELHAREWRDAILEFERARLEYAGILDAGVEDSPAVGRRWLRLWRAERRRDELLQRAD